MPPRQKARTGPSPPPQSPPSPPIPVLQNCRSPATPVVAPPAPTCPIQPVHPTCPRSAPWCPRPPLVAASQAPTCPAPHAVSSSGVPSPAPLIAAPAQPAGPAHVSLIGAHVPVLPAPTCPAMVVDPPAQFTLHRAVHNAVTNHHYHDNTVTTNHYHDNTVTTNHYHGHHHPSPSTNPDVASLCQALLRLATASPAVAPPPVPPVPVHVAVNLTTVGPPPLPPSPPPAAPWAGPAAAVSSPGPASFGDPYAPARPAPRPARVPIVDLPAARDVPCPPPSGQPSVSDESWEQVRARALALQAVLQRPPHS